MSNTHRLALRLLTLALLVRAHCTTEYTTGVEPELWPTDSQDAWDTNTTTAPPERTFSNYYGIGYPDRPPHPRGVFIDYEGRSWPILDYRNYRRMVTYRHLDTAEPVTIFFYDILKIAREYKKYHSPNFWMYVDNPPPPHVPIAMILTDAVADSFIQSSTDVVAFESEERDKDFIIYSILVAMGVTVNIIMLAALLKYKKLQTPTNYFIGSMAIGDICFMLVDSSAKMFFLYYYNRTDWRDTECIIVEHCIISLYCLTVLHNLALAFERYFAICWPMKVVMHCSTTRSLKVIAGLWTLAFILPIPKTQGMRMLGMPGEYTVCAFVPDNTTPGAKALAFYLVGPLFLLPVGCMIYLYVSMSITLLGSVKEAKKMKGGDEEKNDQLKGRIQVVRLLWVVFACFTCSWFPNRVVTVIKHAYEPREVLGIGFGQTYDRVGKVAFANSFMNPILFMLMSRLFRSCVIHMMSCGRYAAKEVYKSTSVVSSTQMTNARSTTGA